MIESPKDSFREEITEFTPATFEKFANEYWQGQGNRIVRYYYYAQRGLGLLNEFKYLGAAIFGVYITMKFTNPIWLAVMVIVSLPPLIIIGYWQLKRIARVSEWVGTHFGSVLGYNTYNIQVRQTKLLEEISRCLKNLEDKYDVKKD